MQYILRFSLVVALYLSLFSCEREFVPEIADAPPEIVVEGYIEAGVDAQATFITITKTLPFFQEIDQNAFDKLYVNDAKVTVTEGDRTWDLIEFCWDDLPDAIRQQVLSLSGIDADSIPFNACVYVDPTFQLIGEYGKKYDLKIEVEDKVLTSSTTIPFHTPIDSLIQIDLPVDSLAQWKEVNGFISDPEDQEDYYRYFTGVNSPIVRPPINSVVNDPFFNGQSFQFPLAKAEPRDSMIEFDLYGLYQVGDTVTIRWANLDAAHYEFWNTFEFNAVNQGPFSSYTRVASNIEGGLGIWGGYSFSEYQIIVK